MEPPTVKPWWERRVPCRAESPGAGCYEEFTTSVECRKETDPRTGEPFKRCVKHYKRLLRCPGRPVFTDESQQELMARGDEVERLEANLELVPPGGLSTAGSSNRDVAEQQQQQHAGGAADASAPAAAGPSGVQTEDVGQAVEDFLRFAEQLHERLAPAGTDGVALDEAPAPAPGGPAPDGGAPPRPDGLLQWLFGAGGWPRKAGRGAVDAKVWQDYAREFTEV
eukprot:scaffold8.g1404.t1